MTSQLYFIEGPKGIKIGITKNVPNRMREFSKHLPSPPVVLGVINGSFPAERAIHTHLAKYSVGNEWFKDCAEVRSFVQVALTRGLKATGIKIKTAAPRLPFVPSEPSKNAIPNIASVLWGHEAAAVLAQEMEQSEETTRAWLDGSLEMPKIARLAFSAIAIQRMFKRE